jgi:hypothetical protein
MPDNETVKFGTVKHSFRMTLPTLGAVSSILSVGIFCTGWIFGYLTFKADMVVVTNNIADLRAENRIVQDRLTVFNQALTDDRQNQTTRLVGMERDIKYIGQTVGELRLSRVPKN